MTDQSKRRRCSPLTGAERDIARDWVMELRTGQRLTIRQISAQVGLGYGTVHQLLTEAGKPQERPVITGTQRDELRKRCVTLYRDNGLTMRQVAEKVGHNYYLVFRLLHEAGIAIRSRGGRKQQ